MTGSKVVRVVQAARPAVTGPILPQAIKRIGRARHDAIGYRVKTHVRKAFGQIPHTRQQYTASLMHKVGISRIAIPS
jgi:hypothetical protein